MGRVAIQRRDDFVHTFASHNNDGTRFVELNTAYLITTMSKYDLKFYSIAVKIIIRL